MTDTHVYDGKLVCDDIPHIHEMESINLEQKIMYGMELMFAVMKLNGEAGSIMQELVSSMGTNKNIDITNMLNADDLIMLCWKHRNNNNFMGELIIQLIDMKTGLCPQGRTHRLFQILLAFE